MAENFNEEPFKLAKKGGYDKEDVKHQFQIVKEAAAVEKKQLSETIEGKDREIAGLNEKLEEQRAEIEKLHRDITEKYQSYIDNYDTIGQVILDSRLQAKKIVEEAYAERDRILNGVQAEADRAVEEVRQSTLSEVMEEKEVLAVELAKKRTEYDALCSRVQVLNEKMEAARFMFEQSALSIRQIAEEEGLLDDGEEGDLDVADTQELDFVQLRED